MPKVLIISYYWPPAGGSGVQRWLKFVKYLRDYGWEPVVYTASNPEAPTFDETLIAEIPIGVETIKGKAFEPYSIYKALFGFKRKKIGVGFAGLERKSFFSKVAVWIRGNLFIPDARMLWIKPSVRKLTKYLKENPVDIIVSTGPPHSTHLIARNLKRKLNIPWVADFRDPWTNIDFYHQLRLTKFADSVHRKMELSVLKECDAAVTVTPSWQADFPERFENKMHVIQNGFDSADFSTENGVALDKDFTITHVGVVPPDRNCVSLWSAIAQMAAENSDFKKALKLRFVGQVDSSVIASLESLNLMANVEITGFVSHQKALEYQMSSQVLLLLVNNSPNAKGILTGKVYEYLAAKRPILAVGPLGGDLDNLLNETKAGKCLPFDSTSSIREGLQWFWEGYSLGWGNFNPQEANRYSRKELTGKMVSIFNDLIKK